MVLRQIGQEEMSDAAGGLQKPDFPGKPVHIGHAVEGPGLAAAPGGIRSGALAAQGFQERAALRIEGDDMAHRAVLPDEVGEHRIRMRQSNMPEPGIRKLLGSPEKQTQVQRRIHDGPACMVPVPGPEEAAGQVEPARQEVGGG
ncbi:hypothetical protein D3C75_692790 [compost metagenome]